MKILLSAYACEAGRGSEPGVGWNTALEIAKYHEVWVLTRPDDGRPAIEAELAQNPNPNLHFVYFTLPFVGEIWLYCFCYPLLSLASSSLFCRSQTTPSDRI
jgi:hypothetical protein